MGARPCVERSTGIPRPFLCGTAGATEPLSKVGLMNAPIPDLTLPDFLDRRHEKPLTFTYTMLNTYENVCPHQCFRRYIKKDIPYVETPEMKFGNVSHEAMELRVGGGKPLPQSLEKMEPIAQTFANRGAKAEQKLGLTAEGRSAGFWDKNVWYRGKLDISIIVNDVGYIPDFKTGKTIREEPLELELNACLLQAQNPHLKKIVGQYVWMPDMYSMRVQPVMGPMHELSNTLRAWETIRRISAAIEEDRKTGEFEKRKSGLCGWCDVMDCELNTKQARLRREGKTI